MKPSIADMTEGGESVGVGVGLGPAEAVRSRVAARAATTDRLVFDAARAELHKLKGELHRASVAAMVLERQIEHLTAWLVRSTSPSSLKRRAA